MSPAEIIIRGHLAARGYGRTFHIAERLGVNTSTARRIMMRLEGRGVVRRDPRSSYVNDICWVLSEQAAGQGLAEASVDGSSPQQDTGADR